MTQDAENDNLTGTDRCRVSEAARYLNAGGYDFKLTPRQVRGLLDNEDSVLKTAFRVNRRGWLWLDSDSVRAERIRLLALVGKTDPEATSRLQKMATATGPASG